jgi:putative ABC transport system ATP-binding protein
MNKTYSIETRSITKRYGVGAIAVEALKGVSLAIAEGEYVAVMGKSGSGKSTLLHMLSALDVPSSGEVLVEGNNVAQSSERALARMRLELFGYVFQDYALLPELTALENVLLPYFMRTGAMHAAARAHGTELLARVGLTTHASRVPAKLSGGEQQRVAIARALVNNPNVLFADEPTANLDSETSETVLGIFDALHTQGLTIVMITHEEEYAKRAERVITLQDGRVV